MISFVRNQKILLHITKANYIENDFTEEMLLLRQMVKSESKKTVSEILQYD